MFTETCFGEIADGIKEDLSVIDLDYGIGKLSVSPVPYESSCMRADESSATMVLSDVSTADVLLSAFDSIGFADHLEQRKDIAKNIVKTDDVGSICESGSAGRKNDEEKDTSKFDSSYFVGNAESSLHGGGEAEVVGKIDKIHKPNHPLIVYTSSCWKSVRNTSKKSNQNNKPSRNCRRIAKKNPVLDINSLQISRRRRSLCSKPARASVWGTLGNILPAFEERTGLDLDLSNEKKPRRVGGGQGKRNASRVQTGRKSVRKSCTPTGHISLKIKIGSQSRGMVSITENFNGSGKSIPVLSDIMESRHGEKLPGDIVLPHGRNSEKVMPSDASVLGSHVDGRGSVENSPFSTSSDIHQIISHEERENLRTSNENRCPDPGTSPDSEVINSVPDSLLFEKGSENMQGSSIMPLERTQECFTNSVPDFSFGDVSSLSLPQMKSKKGKMKDKQYQLGDCDVGSKQTGAETTNNAKAPAGLGPGPEVGDVSYCNDASTVATAKPYSNTYSRNITSEVHNGAEVSPSSGVVAVIESSNSEAAETLIHCTNGRKFPKCSTAKRGHKSRSGTLDLPRKKDKVSKKKGHQNYLVGNQTSSDLGETGYVIQGSSEPINSLQISSDGLRDKYVPPRNAWVLCDECQKWRRIPAALADQIEETNCGWTCKDNTDKEFADCSIPQEKSNSEINEELEISDASCEEDACDALLNSDVNRSRAAELLSWSLIKSNLFLHRSRKTQTIDEVMVCHCKPRSDGRMGCGAKCLNRMLNIECVEGTCPCGELCSNQQFQKREYAKSKWFRCGKKGFGLQALEDISEGQFFIEYVGEVLDMHAYEARQREYALQGHKHFYFMTLNGSEVIDACAKGNLGRFINHSCDPNCRTEKWMVNGEVCVGLFAIRDIKKGEEVTFDYNYVRVFGAAAKKCVCGSPNCQGYIGGDPTNSEVIVQVDSDDEFAEPVMVCEDTGMNDDWNDIMSNSIYDREYESAKEPRENRYEMKKLVNAAGQFNRITSEILIQKVGVDTASTDGCFRNSTATQVVDIMGQDKYELDNYFGNDFASNVTVEQLDTNGDTRESLISSASAASKVDSEGLLSQMRSVQPVGVSSQSEGIMDGAMSSAPHFSHGSEITATALPSNSRPETIESKRKLKYGTLKGREESAKPDSLTKMCHSSSSIKKGKLKSNAMIVEETPNVDKSNAAPQKSKKFPDLSLNNHAEAVEEKLNELLDSEGGISKRRDASRGYLKLLFLTAASGTNGHGEAIQSNRDLSMILDALLKTKSRTVLVDIINKNGLQMLHNIMKRYRKEFIKTPILRKLLKVMEDLAMREILTLEHITGGPPCPGVESFKDSILTLTEHVDKQVHQIARNFRDRWIPRSLRKNCFMETDDGKMEFHQRSSYGRLAVSSYDNWSNRRGKPAEAIECCDTQGAVASGAVETSTLDHSSASGCNSESNGTKARKRKSRWDNPAEKCLHPRIRTSLSGYEKPNVDEDIPPGFSPPCNMVPANSSSIALNRQERDTCIKHPLDLVLGDSEPRFIASMPVSYGVPSSVMQQFGVLQSEASKAQSVAPGLPFHPFPPLPPYPLNKGEPPTLASKCVLLSEPAEKAERVNGTCVAPLSGQKCCSVDTSEMSISVANYQPEGSSYSLGRKCFRQQRWNHPKLVPPWVRMRNGRGHAGNARNGVTGVGLGTGANHLSNSHNSDDFNWRVEF